MAIRDYPDRRAWKTQRAEADKRLADPERYASDRDNADVLWELLRQTREREQQLDQELVWEREATEREDEGKAVNEADRAAHADAEHEYESWWNKGVTTEIDEEIQRLWGPDRKSRARCVELLTQATGLTSAEDRNYFRALLRRVYG
jgi:hypothetical protein